MTDQAFKTRKELQRTPFQEFTLSFAGWCFRMLLLIVGTVMFQRYESTIYPIVPDFVINEVIETEKGLKMSGYMRKARDCTWESVSAQAYEEGGEMAASIPIDFLKEKGIGTRPEGTQKWGQWELTMPGWYLGSPVILRSRHSCNSLWQTPSVLTKFIAARDENGVVQVTTITGK